MQRNRPVPAPGLPQGFGTFRALRHRHYRILWIGMLASALGTWMQIVAQSLLVLRLSGNSAVALGTVSLAQASAFFLFAPLGGTFADRHDKRRLLFRTQTLLMMSAFTLAALTASVGLLAARTELSGAVIAVGRQIGQRLRRGGSAQDRSQGCTKHRAADAPGNDAA